MRRKYLILAICLLLSLSAYTSFASDLDKGESVFETNNVYVNYLNENIARGPNKPRYDASVHDLSVSDYSYQLTNFGYRLYTDKWLTSNSGEISVSLENFRVVEEYGGRKDKITFILFDASGKKLVTSEKYVIGGTADVTWINIKPDHKYYVCFEVPTNGNRYSGNGYITD